MPKRFDFGSVELEAGPQTQTATLPESETPFRILLLGDFTGHARRAQDGAPVAGQRPVAVDRDNFDLVLGRMAPALELGPHIALRFHNLDDFHPDRIYASLEVFRRLRLAREKLCDATTFSLATHELGLGPAPATVPHPAELASGSLLDKAVEAAQARGAPERSPDPLAEYVRRLVAPYLTPRPDPRQKEVLAQVDAAIGGLMRAVLHQPAFQALEAAWRSVFFLVRRLETDGRLRIYLLDISKAELAADLGAGEPAESRLYRLLVEEAVGSLGAEAWSVVAGNYVFEQTRQDAALLARVAKLASQAGAPFLAEAGAEPPEPQGQQAWEALRTMPEAAWIGLALPRFLLRLPYGRQTDPIESFDFEEMPSTPQHQWYLWGNPAFACAYLLGRAFQSWGWEMRPGMVQDIDGLPAHVYYEEGEAKMKPCAELLLSTEAVEEILGMGFMPLVSIKNRDQVRLARFQSIARPPRPLAGPWR